MYRKTDFVSKFFDSRVTRILNSIFIYRMGDFENFSFDNLELTDGAGPATFTLVENVINRYNIVTLDTKINALMEKKNLVRDYILKKRNLNGKKQTINRLQDLVKEVRKDEEYIVEIERKMKLVI
jgi:hypothetical protein